MSLTTVSFWCGTRARFVFAPAILAACCCTAQTNQPAITGSITYRERIALPSDAAIDVQLVDTSLADVTAQTVAESLLNAEGRQVPIPFTLNYDPAQIVPAHHYSVRATIRSADSMLLFSTTQAYPVLTHGSPSKVTLVLHTVGRGGKPPTAAKKSSPTASESAPSDSQPMPPPAAAESTLSANTPAASAVPSEQPSTVKTPAPPENPAAVPESAGQPAAPPSDERPPAQMATTPEPASTPEPPAVPRPSGPGQPAPPETLRPTEVQSTAPESTGPPAATGAPEPTPSPSDSMQAQPQAPLPDSPSAMRATAPESNDEGASAMPSAEIGPGGSEREASRRESDKPSTPLADTQWRLVELGGVEIVTTPPERPFTLAFSPEGTRIAGAAGCNSYRGTFSDYAGLLHLNPIAVPMVGCSDVGADRQAKFVAMLRSADGYKIEDELLVLTNGGKTVAKFRNIGE